MLARGALLLAVGVLLPLLVVAGWQEGMTARVLDTRHLWLALSAWLVALCGYLAGAYAMLANRRYAVAGFIPARRPVLRRRQRPGRDRRCS